MKSTLTAKDKAKVRDTIHCDDVSFKKDGSVQFKQSFFYRHRGSADNFGRSVERTLKEAGYDVKVVSTEEQWKAWPKTSYWVVVANVTKAKEKETV